CARRPTRCPRTTSPNGWGCPGWPRGGTWSTSPTWAAHRCGRGTARSAARSTCTPGSGRAERGGGSVRGAGGPGDPRPGALRGGQHSVLGPGVLTVADRAGQPLVTGVGVDPQLAEEPRHGEPGLAAVGVGEPDRARRGAVLHLHLRPHAHRRHREELGTDVD